MAGSALSTLTRPRAPARPRPASKAWGRIGIGIFGAALWLCPAAALTSAAHAACDSPGALLATLRQLTGVADQQTTAREYQGIRFTGTRILPGRHGGRLIEMQTVRQPILPDDYIKATEFNAEVIEHRFGPAVASFFGFKTLDRGRHTQPDPAEINGAYRELNRRMKSASEYPADFFYEAAGKISDRDYLIRLARDGRLPLAKSGWTRVHDLSAHWMWSILPPSARSHAMQLADELNRFSEWVGANLPQLADETVHGKMFQNLAETTDYGSANWSRGFREGILVDRPRSLSGLRQLLSNGASPAHLVRSYARGFILQGQPPEARQAFLRAFKEYERSRISANPKYEQSISPEQVLKELEARVEITESLISPPLE